MSAMFSQGQLVEITGFSEPERCPQEWRARNPPWKDEPEDLRGQRGQLVSRSGETGLWLVATMSASMAPVNENNLRLLKTDDMDNLDAAFGPCSKTDVLGNVIASHLAAKGHALCQLFISSGDLEGMQSCANGFARDGLFKRLPSELERGFLGRGGRGKTMELDMRDLSMKKCIDNSPLRAGENAISTALEAVRLSTSAGFYIDIHSRTSTLLILPFDGDEHLFENRSCTNLEASKFLETMDLAKVAVFLNAGPQDVTLHLAPKPGSGDLEFPTIRLHPGTLVVFDCVKFNFSYKCKGQALIMMTWFLEAPISFDFTYLDGALSKFVPHGPPLPRPQGEHVNIVSLAHRLNFGIDEPWKYWASVKSGVDIIREIPLTRFDINEYYDENGQEGKSYTKHAGLTDGIEHFDHRFFDVSPAEAKTMDPSQRQLLEVGYTALQKAGYTKQSLKQKSETIGITVAFCGSDWPMIAADQGAGGTGSNHAIVANRFSYALNLKGPSFIVDTACSSSLVATHAGKLHLLNSWDACSAYLTGGVHLLLGPSAFIAFSGAGMLSHKGRCFTFDCSADGYTRSEGTVIACMKLHGYEKGKSLCILSGSNINQDGKSATLTAPNGPSQERVIESVLREAGVTAAEVDAFECHGTGTALGDPIEIGANRKVQSACDRDGPAILTSFKSNAGHGEGVAGINGFVKCVLMCMHAEGTSNQHLKALNPHIDMEDFDAVMPTEGIILRGNASITTVSSFGFGGTNACGQCWGENTQTSRAPGSKIIHDKDKAFAWRIEKAPAPTVHITGSNWEDWEQDGPWKARPGDKFNLKIDKHGRVTCSPREETRKLGDAYFVSGTFNKWAYEPLDVAFDVPGLHTALVVIGSSGEELFQIVADKDSSMCFYPKKQRCEKKSTAIHGPEPEATKELAWCLKGEPGDVYKIEFYKSRCDAVSISWVLRR